MITFFTYVMIYAPPLIGAFFCYRWQKRKQETARQKNMVLLYLLPFIVFTVISLVWSGLLYLVARWLSGPLPSVARTFGELFRGFAV